MNDLFPRSFRLFLTVVAGGLAATSFPRALEALTGPDVPVLWWTARAFGLLAYVALWLSSLFGVFVAGRGAGGVLDRAMVLQLHHRWALVALVATAVHVLAIVVDRHANIGTLAAFVPFASARLRGPVALGSVALWGMALVAGSTAAIRRLPPATWRAIHATAFGTLVLALAHGATAGTETSSALVRGLYAGTAAVMVAAVAHRIFLAGRIGWPASTRHPALARERAQER